MPQYTSRKPLIVTPQVQGLNKSFDDIGKALSILQDYCREVSDRLNSFEKIVQDTGLAPTFAIPGESGIQVNSLVHVSQDGVAYLADATNTGRYATDVAVNVAGRQITCYSLGTWALRAVPFTGTNPVLYLSDRQPGFVQNYAPTTEGYVRQLVGFAKGPRDAISGLVRVNVTCAEYTLL